MKPEPGPEGRLRFCLRADVAIEDFGDRSLVLLGDSLQLREINGPSRRMLGLLDGERTVQDIAAELAPTCESPEAVAEALLEMERQGIVRRAVKWMEKGPGPMSEAKYLANPDVSFRTEDDDGGILFHLEADAVEVINPTAAEIWKFLAAPHTQAEVVAHLCAVCRDAPSAQVAKDVAEFVESLRNKGFIGVVAPPP